MDTRFTALADAGLDFNVVTIPSANPVNFHDAIKGSPTGIDIDGALILPSGGTPTPAVIVVPGSAGVSENHLRHSITLSQMGYAVLLLDPFTARSVTSTVANQTQYSFAASAFDVLAALKFMSTIPQVDTNRISAQGHSRGGAAVIQASMRVLADAVVGTLSLAGAYAAYPWCGQQFLSPNVGTTVVRSIIGDQDEWCSVSAAQSQMHAISLSGGSASTRVVPGAHHSFDRYEDIYLIEEARVSPDAPIEFIADDGAMVNPTTGVADIMRCDIDQFRYAVEAGFGRKGAQLGGTTGQPELFVTDMLAFHREVFGR